MGWGVFVNICHCMADIALSCGQRAMQKSDFVEAIKFLQKGAYWRKEGIVKTEQARCLLATERYSQAARLFKEVIAENPYIENAYLNLGFTYIKQRQPEQALNLWLDNLWRYHFSSLWYYNLGKLYLEMGKGHAALIFLQKVTVFNPQKSQDLNYTLNLALAYEITEESWLAFLNYQRAWKAGYSNAMQAMKRILNHLKLRTTRGTVEQKAKAYLETALIYEQIQQAQAAINCYLESLRLFSRKFPGSIQFGQNFLSTIPTTNGWQAI